MGELHRRKFRRAGSPILFRRQRDAPNDLTTKGAKVTKSRRRAQAVPSASLVL
jgi:hypothetical protein